MNINQIIADELQVQMRQVAATIELLKDGATVPFISRYRKEVTGGLTDTQLRALEERLTYLEEVADRQQAILKSIRSQEKLTAPLEKKILATLDKTELEDIYLPYKPKRRTKAQIAREAGLQPLADRLWKDPTQDPATVAQNFLNAEHAINEPQEALAGAKQILMEQFAEKAEVLAHFRDFIWQHALVESTLMAAQADTEAGQKFSDYFDYVEPLNKIPSHRALALFRGRKDGFLRVRLQLSETDTESCLRYLGVEYGITNRHRPADSWLLETLKWTWQIKLLTRLELDAFNKLRERSEEVAIDVFAKNLQALLMAAPAGSRCTMGLDPGLRTGVKIAIVDATGNVVCFDTIYPHPPQKQWDAALARLGQLIKTYGIELISIGNGTASRETERLAAELAKLYPECKLQCVVVSEAGASVYSASEVATNELPDLDVTIRGAVSIARRLQDPLAELVKIEPKAIGVGQYQHDVNQAKLRRSLDGVIEDCVNAVGVDVNLASVPLLSQVSGLNATIAQNIVSYRQQHGPFRNRQMLRLVPRLGDKTFEQAVGFLRIREGENPLDASAVHPESYSLIEKISKRLKCALHELIGNEQLLKRIQPMEYIDANFGLPTIQDIVQELKKPGRDPRPEFVSVKFKEGVETLADLKEGMILEGAVSNVTNFGAFVDIGVHQDGLVHISQLAEKYVADPRDVVIPGQVVKVKVMSIDSDRKRVSLTMRFS